MVETTAWKEKEGTGNNATFIVKYDEERYHTIKQNQIYLVKNIIIMQSIIYSIIYEDKLKLTVI